VDFVAAGRTFLLLGGRPGDKPHLWVILLDPDPTTGQVVAVHLVTAKEHTDPTVTLNLGDHPFVKHETHVNFGGAKFYLAHKIERAIAKGRCKLNADASKELLAKLRAGLLASSRTANFMVTHCRERFPAQ